MSTSSENKIKKNGQWTMNDDTNRNIPASNNTVTIFSLMYNMIL